MDAVPSGAGIGQPVRRREDFRLITGACRYSDDLVLPNQAYAAMVRSPHAHAPIRSLEIEAQPLAGSFMDDAMPRADRVPHFDCDLSEVPSPTRPLGIRPACEGGTTPPLAGVINAVVDALAEFGVRHVEMPATSERVWRAIRAARQGGTRCGEGVPRCGSISGRGRPAPGAWMPGQRSDSIAGRPRPPDTSNARRGRPTSWAQATSDEPPETSNAR
jgi:xanthine dehydrogenase molybdopterin-binding subunit B